MKRLIYILIVLTSLFSFDYKENNTTSECARIIYQNFDSTRSYYFAIDSVNVYSKISGFNITDSLLLNKEALERFRPYLRGQYSPRVRLINMFRINGNTEMVVLHENVFCYNMIYGFIARHSNGVILDTILLAGRIDEGGAQQVQSSTLKFENKNLIIEQKIKECTKCSDYGDGCRHFFCDSCVTINKIQSFSVAHQRLITGLNER